MRKKYNLKHQPVIGINKGYLAFLLFIILFQATSGYSQLITNVTATTGHAYTVSQTAVGTTIYTDRVYQITTIPAFLNNTPFIKTPNDDKANKGASILSFNLTQSATVYVAYDPRATVLPAWLSNWQKLASQLGINDPKISNLDLYSKSFAAGSVVLGGNLASPAAGALNNYLVIAVAQLPPPQYNLTVNTSGNGTVNKNPDQAAYDSGTNVILTATPAAGQQFTGWSGAVSSTENPLTVPMDADKLITAAFSPIQYTLTVTPNGNGTVTKSPDQATYASGTSVTLTATPAAGQQFSGWSGDTTGNTNPLSVTLNSNKNITANFTPTSSALITNISATSGRSYTLGQLVTGSTFYTDRVYQVTSTPSFLNNAAFIKAANDDKASKATSLLSFSLTQNATVYIAYDPRVTILPAWLSGWQKLASQVGINDPKISFMDLYSKNFPAGQVTLGGNLATPAAGAQNNYFVIALVQAQYNLIVTTNGNGTAAKNPDQAGYSTGTDVTLTATPTSGYQFTGWTGSATSTSNPLTIVMNADKAVTASFAAITGNGRSTVNPVKIYDNDVTGGAAGISRKITVKNNGAGVLSLSSINTSGANGNQFVLSGLPIFPKAVNAGDSIFFFVAFNPSSTGLKTASINVNSDDVTNPSVAVSLRGLGTPGLGGANEPSLQSILNLLEIPVTVGDDNVSTAVINSSGTLQKAPLLGEEVSLQKFQKADTGNITITPLAIFGPTDSATIVGMGWYKSGNASLKSELFTVSNNPISNGQTVNVNFTGTLSFNPATDTFGFYSRWPYFGNRHLYSEDNLNTFPGSIPHHVRVFPYKNSNGIVVPNTYLIAFEEHTSGFDYQDIVFVAKNLKTIVPDPPKAIIIPEADAFIRDGTFAAVNFGSDTALVVKSTVNTGLTRFSYLKFPLNSISKVRSAKLRLYGRNTQDSSTVNISSFSIDDDTWTENGITFNNAPLPSLSLLGSAAINYQEKYYDFDVTAYVKDQFDRDKVVSFLIKDANNKNINFSFNSKEKGGNIPQLVVDTVTVPLSNALIFVENLDKFPSNDNFVFSRIQIPWTRDSVTFNSNHDSLKVRIHNKGINPLIIANLDLSDTSKWKIDKLNTTPYVPGAGLPAIINSGTFLDVTLKFIAVNQAARVKILHETLNITSNDDEQPVKTVFLHGIWQKTGEGDNEPYSQEMMDAFGFKTNIGFVHTDPDLGDSTQLKGDEIKPSYFVRANPSLPVSIRQMSAYHGCCVATEKIDWFAKGSATFTSLYTHIVNDGQTLFPRKSLTGGVTSATFSPTTAFGLRIGSSDYTDATKNPGKKIGIRIWKAFDSKGNIIPNSYIISNDYLGSPATNYDYNDNLHFITNVKPQTGSVFFSTLAATPSALDFGEKILQTNDSLLLNLKNLGQTYANGSSDPAITISSVEIRGENRFEFSASLPANTTLTPQQLSAMTVKFKPLTQGLKIADLLIYYNNSLSPLRVPLYGIARAADTTVVVNYRIKGGSPISMTINGKTWSADTAYARDNLEPFSNASISQIAATDEDSLYFKEQSSNGDKKPFRYQILNIPNGNYVVRLHFAEVFWGTVGTGLTGGAGSRIMSVKLENQLRLINFDIVQEVGSAAAVIKNFPVTVTDGILNIDFSATVNRPSLSALEVYSFEGPAHRGISSSSIPVKSSLTSSDADKINSGKLKLYPNPLHEKFTIEFPGRLQGDFTIEISDLVGRTYKIDKTRLKTGRSRMEVNISNLMLKAGVYFLRIHSDSGKNEVTKLIIQ